MKSMTRVALWRWVGALWVFVALGCGYQFAGQSERFPKEIKTVLVDPFVNKTHDVGIDMEMTAAVKGELYRRGQLRVVDRLDQADSVLTGVIRSLDTRVVSVNRKDEVLQYETVLIVDATLRRLNPDEILWRGQGTRLAELHSGSRAAVVTTSSDFRAGTLNTSDVRRMTDIQLTESESRETREKLIERFARELHQRFMEMF